MKTGQIIIFSGPSGSGKTTLYKKVLKDPQFRDRIFKITTVTTRSPREGEQNGKDYIFISREQFFYKERAGYFLESQKVFDNYYGTPKDRVQKMLWAGKNVLLCIDVKGARAVSRQFPEAIKVFIKAASLSVLKKRIQKRGVGSKEDLDLRLKIARQELKEAKNYQYVVLNDNLKHCYKSLKVILQECLWG